MTMTMLKNHVYGGFGLGGSLAAVAADLELQYTSVSAHVGSANYAYLMDVSVTDLTIGHFLGVPAILAEIAGFWFVSRGLLPRDGRLANLFLASSATAFTLGAAFHAMFAPIGLAMKQASSQGASAETLAGIAAAVRPVHQGLGAAVMIGMLVYSLVFAWAVSLGRSAYPRWGALASPLVFVLCMVPAVRLSPFLRGILVPCGLNLANAVLFGMCLLFDTRPRKVMHPEDE
ncbi:MAG TPA: DUF6796 family protein [Candidatus Acidoferrales bacterium]|nr:DUF6796 family protein [Candidatus Acidoferrales bacterium]